MAENLISDEFELNKDRLKILYGGKSIKKVPMPETLSKRVVSTPQKIKEQKISTIINLSTNYYKMDNNVSDFLNPIQTPVEQVVYNRLYRLSIGYQKNVCRIGMGALAKATNIKSSQKTIKKAVEGLIKKGHIAKYDTNKKGTLYQIFLPNDIKGVKNTIVNSTMVKNTIVNSTPTTVVKNTIPYGKIYYSSPNFTDDVKNPKDNLKTCLKDNNNNSSNNVVVVVSFFNKQFEKYQKTLSIETTEKLLRDHNVDKILAYINRISNINSIRNPAGFLYKALNNKWELTPTKEEIINKEKLFNEKELKTQQEKDRIEKIIFEIRLI